MKRQLLAATLAALATAGAQAGGFQVNLQGQKNIGMGHAGTGLALDQASIFFNPGALSHIRQNGVQLGVSGIISNIAYRGDANNSTTPSNYTAKSDNSVGTPFQVYAAFGQKDGPLKFGLGVYTPFGSSVKWETGWIGEDALREIDLSAIFIQPTVSFKVNDKVGIGGGFVYATGGVNLQRRFPRANEAGQFGNVEFDGSGSGVGYNVGVYVKPTEKLSFGLTYRSKVDMKVDDGDLTFTNIPTSLQAAYYPNTSFTATLPLPSNLTLGIGIMPDSNLTIAIDIQRVGWSAYDKLRFDFGQPIGNPAASSSEAPRNYEDVMIYRLGVQYQLTKSLAIRAGGYYDQSPVQDGYITAETPDADAIGLSAGLGYTIGEHLQLDVSFLYIDKKERTDLADKSLSQGGIYKTKVAIPGLGLTYNF